MNLNTRFGRGRLPLLLASVSILLVLVVPISAQDAQIIPLSDPSIMPEGIEFNPATGTYLVSSLVNGTIYAVAADGTVTPFIEDPALTSTVGIHVDAARNRLLVVNSSLGAMIAGVPPEGMPEGGFPEGMPTPEGGFPAGPPQGGFPEGMPTPEGGFPEGFPGGDMAQLFGDMTIGLLAYDLTTGAQVLNVDLSSVAPAGVRFANDVTVDADGNVYITDSLSAVIYRVDVAGSPLYLSNAAFQTPPVEGAPAGFGGLSLNGIEYLPSGALIVGKSTEGVLLKVPLSAPDNVTVVTLPEALTGADGITLLADGRLAVVSGQQSTVFILSSTDDWATAAIDARYTVGAGATTAAVAGTNLAVLTGALALDPTAAPTLSITLLPLG